MIYVDDIKDGKAGSIEIRHCENGDLGGIAFRCPGCGEESYIPLDKDMPNTWTLVSEEPLTIRPSVLDRKCGWHGWLRNGEWHEC